MVIFKDEAALYLSNVQNGRFCFDGFTSSEIAAYNRRLMFGENDEAFPDNWSSVVD